MYTGYILLFGYLSTLDIVSEIFGKKYEIEAEDYYELSFIEDINSLLQDKGYKFIELIYQKCCYHDKNKVFFAVELGDTNFAYRQKIEKFQTFEIYDNYYRKQLDDIKKMYIENEDKILKEFERFSKEFNLDDLQRAPKFYTISNDCESCT